MSSVPAGKIVLRSSDKETFEVDEAVALVSKTIKNMVEDVSADTAIPLPNVNGKTLAKVLEYCKKHVEELPKKSEEGTSNEKPQELSPELKAFDAEFIKVDQNILFDVVLAANYLDIKGLLDLTCQAIAEKIKDKSVEQVRKLFHIENDFTPEEEEALRKENEWAYEV